MAHSSYNKDGRPNIAIISDSNILAGRLASGLEKRNCHVDLFSGFDSETKGTNLRELCKDVSRYDYLIFIKLNQNKENQRNYFSERYIKLIKNSSKNGEPKVTLIFPYTQKGDNYEKLEILKNYLRNLHAEFTIIYLGELIDENTNFRSESNLEKLLTDAVKNNKVEGFKKDFVYHPLKVRSAVRQIIKNLFSFGFYGKEAAIVSSGITQNQLINIIERQIGKTVRINHKRGNYFFAETKGKIIVRQDLEKVITDRLNIIENTQWLSKESTGNRTPNRKTESQMGSGVKRLKASLRSLSNKWFLKGFLILVTLFLLPTFLLTIDVFSQKIAWEFIKTGDTFVVPKVYSASESLSVFLSNYFGITRNLQLKNFFIYPPKTAAEILTENAEVGFSTLRLMREYDSLFNSLIEQTDYGAGEVSGRITTELDYLYKKLGFIESEVNQLSGYGKKAFSNLVLGQRNAFIKENAPQISRILQYLPELLGADGEKTYALVLQNSTNIRPTGGVIVSLAFITVSNGSITNIEYSGVEELDTNLKGYVFAPELLSKYFGVNSWSLKDSNWDSDFSFSAEQIEWFLDKESDRRLDGILSIDTIFIPSLLEITGPIGVKNSSTKIDANNFQTSSQFINDNNLWKELFSELVNKTIKLKGSGRIKLLRIISTGFEDKDIQVFLHNAPVQKAILEMNWGGGLPEESCPDNCFVDWLGLVESATTENGASVFIRRSANLDMVFEGGLIKRRYVVLLENLAEKNSGFTYSVYIRAEVPIESGFSPVVVKNPDGEKELIPDIVNLRGHKEAGVYIEVQPKSSVTLQFIWESPNKLNFQTSGEYSLVLRKQSGIPEFPTKINIDNIGSGVLVAEPNGLTGDEGFEYNTMLSRDFVSRIYW